VAVVRIDDAARDALRDFAEANGVSQAALLAALVARLHLSRIDVTEAIEEARAADTEARRRG
jgi:hypothetical protein